MTLEEAIKCLADDIERKGNPSFEKINKAEQLGIEAMKWVKRYRPRNKVDNWSLLPGETERKEGTINVMSV